MCTDFPSIRHVQGKVKEIFGSRRPKDLDFDPKLRPRDSDGMNQRIRAFMHCKEQWIMLKQRTRMSAIQLSWEPDRTRYLAHTTQDHSFETEILQITPSEQMEQQSREPAPSYMPGNAIENGGPALARRISSHYGPQAGLGAYDSNLIQSFPDDMDDLMFPDWDDSNAGSAWSEHSLPKLGEPYLYYNDNSSFGNWDHAHSNGQALMGTFPATKEDRKRARNREAQRLHRMYYTPYCNQIPI